MREHRSKPSVARAGKLSLSFSAFCKFRGRRLANGTRDAKDFGFDHVRMSQPTSDLCLGERESVAAPSVETRRELLCHPICHA